MSNWDNINFAQQGWQCPICHAIWSPTTPMCYNCTGKEKTYTFGSGKYKVNDINKYIENVSKYIDKYVENINTNKYSNVTITNSPSTKTIHNGETDYDK